MDSTEINRIDNSNQGELPETTYLVLTINNLQTPELVLDKTKEIIRIIAEYTSPKVWPSDAEWKLLLPDWFVKSMTTKSIEEILQNEFQWHFESWMESMENRAWVWWSSKIENETLTIVLETLNIPYIFEQLLYVFYAQGIIMDNISSFDEIYGLTKYGK